MMNSSRALFSSNAAEERVESLEPLHRIAPELLLICGCSEFRQYAIGDPRTLGGLIADDSPKYSP